MRENERCPGTTPDEAATAAAREAAIAAYDNARNRSATWAEHYGDQDPLWGRKGCGVCGKAYPLNADGTLRKHKGAKA